jgi:pyruvate formate lyase activating enzyme
MQAYIGGFLQNNKNIWKDHNSLIIYFAGSNYKCDFFNNPQFKNQKKEFLTDISLLKKEIKKYSHISDSIVFSGGEPTLQKEPLLDLIKFCKKEKLKTLVITNGSKPNILKKISKLTKIRIVIPTSLDSDWKSLVKFSGYFIDEKEIKENIITSIKENNEFYTELIPGIIFRKEQFLLIAKLLPENSNWIIKIKKEKNLPSKDYVNDLINGLKKFKKINITLLN